MAKMTLLEMVQNILSALDSDEVNSIGDTTEALQVAYVVKETFEEQFNGIHLPYHQGLIQITGLGLTASPNYMEINTDLKNFSWVKYKNFRNNERFENVAFVTPEEFLDLVLDYTADSGNIFLTTDIDTGVQYYIKSNKAPTYYTSFNNTHIVFDSFDIDYETTAHQENTLAFGTIIQDFLLEDDFIPPLPETLFPLLLSEAKSTCFINLKQISSTKEEQRARRQRVRMQNDEFKSKSQQRRHIADAPNYARNRW